MEETPTEYFIYEYDAETQGVRITKYIGDFVRMRISDEIEGESVTSIGEGGFKDIGISYAHIPNAVTIIG